MTLHRRTFLERLGLGAAGAILGPIAMRLVSEARGAVAPRKRIIFFMHGNGMHYEYNFTPPEFRAAGDAGFRAPVMDGPKNYTWPAMLKALAPHRSRMLLVDGLANVPRTGTHGHSAGYAALSCFPAANGASNDGNGLPGNITIDQAIANKIGADTRRKSVLFGVSQRDDGQLARVFAGGPQKPEPHFQSPALLYNDLFGTLVRDDSGVSRGAIRQSALLGAMRTDIKRLQGALAGIERRKLDNYLAAIDDFDRRERGVAAPTCKISLDPPAAAAPGVRPSTEDRLDAMVDMGALALVCGLTNVVGISVGCGNAHDYFPNFTRITAGTPYANGGINGGYVGHDPPETQGPKMELIHNYHGGLIAKMIASLSAIKEGDKSIYDNTVILYTSDNGEQHHAEHDRWPLVLIGDAGGALKSDGRFIRFPRKGQAGWRSMADLYCSLATACGAPMNDFGKGGNEKVEGPLETLMA